MHLCALKHMHVCSLCSNAGYKYNVTKHVQVLILAGVPHAYMHEHTHTQRVKYI